MYIINIMKTKTIYQLKEENLQILFGKIVEIEDWNSPSLKTSFWRCYCPLEKGGTVIYQGEKIPLEPGLGYIIPSLTNFKGSNKRTFTKAFCHFIYEVRNLSFNPGIYQFTIPKDLLKKITLQKDKPTEIIKSTFELSMLQLVSLGLSTIPDSAKQELKYDIRIQNLLDFIQKNTPDGVNNNELANRVNLTIPSMIRLFKENVGTSPQKYLKTLRVQKAGTLLVHTEKSLEEIAEECGFWDRNHFTRAFTDFLQCPPATYRKLNRG